jgi:septal ring factor EnvC (AmiA/AmiB activator)
VSKLPDDEMRDRYGSYYAPDAAARNCTTHFEACDCKQAAHKREIDTLRASLAAAEERAENWHQSSITRTTIIGRMERQIRRLEKKAEQERTRAESAEQRVSVLEKALENLRDAESCECGRWPSGTITPEDCRYHIAVTALAVTLDAANTRVGNASVGNTRGALRAAAERVVAAFEAGLSGDEWWGPIVDLRDAVAAIQQGKGEG